MQQSSENITNWSEYRSNVFCEATNKILNISYVNLFFVEVKYSLLITSILPNKLQMPTSYHITAVVYKIKPYNRKQQWTKNAFSRHIRIIKHNLCRPGMNKLHQLCTSFNTGIGFIIFQTT